MGNTLMTDTPTPVVSSLRSRLPGIIAAVLMVGVTSMWTFWGSAEMVHEGWFGAWHQRLRYFIPGGATLLLTLSAIRFPRVGGLMMIIAGGLFTVWWARLTLARSGDWGAVLVNLPLSGLIVVLGVLFLLEGRRRARCGSGLRRRWLVLAAAVPLIVSTVTLAAMLPRVLTRLDDGDRGARLIEYDDFAVVWAPDGPGWAPGWGFDGGHPSWKQLALYGLPPVGFEPKEGWRDRDPTLEDMARWGLPRYLSRDGTKLESEPVDVWRMPTVEELVRSLCSDGRPVGATWDGRSKRAHFDVEPEKETPLWAPDRSPIYMWAADEYDEDEAFWVSYNGWVQHQPKTWGNPRHGFRLVRDP